MTINGLLRQQQRLANIMDSPALRLRRRINGLLRQQQRLADIMDPPALRLGRELQERNKLFQAHENILAQFRPNDTLAELLRNFNKTQQSIMDNARKAVQPLALPVAMNQRLKSVGTELVAQTTAAAGIIEATQRSRDIVAPVSSLHRQHQSIIQDHFRRTDLLQQSFRSHFLPFHNALTESATAAAGIIEATRKSIEITDPLSGCSTTVPENDGGASSTSRTTPKNAKCQYCCLREQPSSTAQENSPGSFSRGRIATTISQQ